jgi:hypothetical protein
VPVEAIRLGGRISQRRARAIALAVETSATLLLMDEKRDARRAGVIPLPRTEIARLRIESGSFISREVEAHTPPDD